MGLHTQDGEQVDKFGIALGLVAKRKMDLQFARLIMMLNTTSASSTGAGKPVDRPLNHPNLLRPTVSHRLPSRRVNLPSPDFLELAKKAIAEAQNSYQEYYLKGKNDRQANGWFSGWRHTEDGQKRARDVLADSQKMTDLYSLLEYLDLFFNIPETPYNNHSFASYLIVALSGLLAEESGLRLSQDSSVDKNSWVLVVEQLRKLVPDEKLVLQNEVPSGP